MYYGTSNGLIIGVLNDYDLSSMRDTPTGTERRGTIPFMVVDLLTKEALQGKVAHLYRHDAESFIWVLIWVCLRYENGVLKGTMLNEWLREDALGCHNNKASFVLSGRLDGNTQPTSSHQFSWEIAQLCIEEVGLYSMKRLVMTDEVAFHTFLKAHVPSCLENNILDIGTTL
jgi:hypothetical protein